MKFAIVLCLIFLVVSAHDDHAPDADRHFHENQIPPPNQQPSKEDIQEILKEVFAKIDTDSDGLITTDELKVWLDKIHKSLIDENLSQQWSYYNPEIQEVHSWEKYDPETKETISWELYINSTYPEEVIKAAGGEKIESDDPNFHSYLIMFKRAEKRWKAADENNDNVLVKEEFKNFIHPEESEQTKHILVEEAMDDMDADKNGEVSFEEYIKHMTEVSAEEEKQNPEFLQVIFFYFDFVFTANPFSNLFRINKLNLPPIWTRTRTVC